MLPKMLPEHVSSVLINGDKLQLESVLFECAIHFAELGLNIWFISPQPFNEIPENIKPPDKEALKLITFLYLKDQKDLLTHMNGIHLWHKLPQIVVLNGYEHYCMMSSPDFNLVNAAFTTASLLDAVSACAFKYPDKKAYLLVACNVNVICSDKQLNTLTEMYFPNVVLYDNTKSKDIIPQIKKCFNESV